MKTKKIITISIIAVLFIIGCVAIGIYIFKEKTQMNLWGEWFSQNGVNVALAWDDPRGIQQVRSSSDVIQNMNISSAFQAISNPQKNLFLPNEARSGLIAYQLTVTGENRTVLYSIQNNYIIIADEKSPKHMTIWKVSPSESEGLIRVITDNTKQ